MIWDLVWAELGKTHEAEEMSVPDFGATVPTWAKSRDVTDTARRVQDEEDEKEFRCPNLERMSSAVTKALQGTSEVEVLDAEEIYVSPRQCRYGSRKTCTDV
jgi:U3 small nucleolar RNA-associated protein 20